MHKQEAPFAVQVELTEGCNLRCSFCGVNGIRGVERTYKFMTPVIAEAVALNILYAGWNPRFEFAMHGEPTMNPDAAKIVGIFRKYFPKASMLMLSNGGGLVKDPAMRIHGLFQAGLNTLGLDEYEGINLVPKIMEAVRVECQSPEWMGWQVLVYPDDPDGNPHKPQKPGSRRLVHIKPISLNEKGTHATLNNHCGAGAPKNASGQGKRCAKPFRELSVRWDGNVAICCNDWRGVLALGNLTKEPMDAVWNGPVAQAARKALYHGQRTFGPCKGCDATSYRVGLLPDKMGKVELPKPTKKDMDLLEVASVRKQLAKTVRRDWE